MIARTGIIASSRTQSTPLPSVTIGTQIWSLYNLDVDKYRNGDSIPEVTDNAQWQNLILQQTGAWCWYANNSANGLVYGKLYNWFAVKDLRGLAPIGWHVPSDAEWTTLTNFLGGEPVAGGALKSTTGWAAPNTGATNSSGFTALPGGFRAAFNGFFLIGSYNYYWSSTDFGPQYGKYRFLRNDSASVGNGHTDVRTGMSIRLIKD